MSTPQKAAVQVQGISVAILAHNEQGYISLTDIARHKDPERTDYLISNWLRNRNTVEIKEFQRLKAEENVRLSAAWNLNRTLSKLNYRIHTDAIKVNLIPDVVTLWTPYDIHPSSSPMQLGR